MKKSIFLLIFGIALIAIFPLLDEHLIPRFRVAKKGQPTLDKGEIGSPNITYSNGMEDQPYARNDFEFMRTQSPRTLQIPENIRAKELKFSKSLPKSNLLRSSRNGSSKGRTTVVDLNFESRGPINVGGRTRAIAFDVSDPTNNTILAGGVSGGMWRTVDQGENWVRTTTPDQFPSVVSLVQDTRAGNENIWYYGTGEITGNSASGDGGAIYRGDGIYRSTDSGQSWSQIPATSTGDITNTDNNLRFVNNLVINTTNLAEDELYAAAIDGIIRTTDGFQTFDYVLGDASNTSLYTDVAITSTGRLYATVSDDIGSNSDIGIWRSDDGINWTEIPVPSGSPSSGFQRTTIGISPSNENIVYFFRTEASGEDFNLYVYDDTDQSMIARPQSALPLDLGGPVGDLDTQGSYDQYVRVHPTNPDIVFLGAVNLYRSTNGFTDGTQTQWIGGYSFRANEQGSIDLYISHHPDQHELRFFPGEPNRAISATDGGISVTQNILKSDTTEDSFFDSFFEETVIDDVVIDWDPIDEGYKTGQFYTVAINSNDPDFPWIVGGLQDNSSHLSDFDNFNRRWGDLFGGDGAFAQLTFNSLIVSAQFAQPIRFSIVDDGTETGSISPPNAGDTDEALFVNPILADPVIPNKVFIAGRGAIYYTYNITDNPSGDDWLTLGGGTIPTGEFVTAMDASVSPGHQLVFSTYNLNTRQSLVFRVENTNEPDVISNLSTASLPDGYINSIEIDPRNSNNITLVYSNYDIISLYNSQDGGSTWTPIAGNLEENVDGSGNGVSTRWLEIMPNGTGNIYLVGTSAGLYYTEQLNGNGTVWTQAGENTIGNVVIDMLAVRPIDGYVVVATHGNGVYQANIDIPLQANIYADVFLCSSGPLSIFANQETNTDNFSYQWFVNDELVPNVNASGISSSLLLEETTFQVEITDTSTGETSLSNELVLSPISLSFCDQILSSEPLEIGDFQVYPNPSSDFIKVTVPVGKEPNYMITDLGGNRISLGVLGNEGINVSSFAAGTYILTIVDGDSRVSRKFVKVN